MSGLEIAAIQMRCHRGREGNVERAVELIRAAAAAGARIVLLPELFESLYFCQVQDPRHFALALPLDGHPTVARLSAVAAELEIVLPVPVFERSGANYYNTVVVVDADGSRLGHYRKSHIPDGPGYCEKYYFTPGDTGFRVWSSRYASIGVGICWDQWFPECARAMALQGAELLLYPSAIGSEPDAPELDTCQAWRRVMQGHAVANCVPVVASNRVGAELAGSEQVAAASSGRARASFYGSSFVADVDGTVLAQGSRDREEVVHATIDLARVRAERDGWGFFRDRRPELYRELLGHARGRAGSGDSKEHSSR